MANPSVVGTPAIASAASPVTSQTVSATVTAGNLLVLFIGYGATFTLSAVSGGGATWASQTSVVNPGGVTEHSAIYIGTGTTGGSITVSVTGGGSADNILLTLYEVANSGGVEAATSGSHTIGTTSIPVSATPATTGDLAIFYVSDANSGSGVSGFPTSPWTSITGPAGSGGVNKCGPTAYQAGVTGGTPLTATWTLANSAGVATFGTIIIQPAGGTAALAPAPSIFNRAARMRAANW